MSKPPTPALFVGMRSLLVFVGVAGLAGCFEEETATRDASAVALVDSLAAFAEIQANLTTDPAKAGAAVGRFMLAPVAAGELLQRPFEASAAARAAGAARITPAGIPACLTSDGTAGCDGFETEELCEAGDIQLAGEGSRTCVDCDPAAVCTYTWDLSIDYTTADFSIVLDTRSAGTTVDGPRIQFDATLAYTATFGQYQTAGDVRICSCGEMTIESGSPVRPVSSSLVAKDTTAIGQRCALVTFDAAGAVTVTDACVCGDGGCQ